MLNSVDFARLIDALTADEEDGGIFYGDYDFCEAAKTGEGIVTESGNITLVQETREYISYDPYNVFIFKIGDQFFRCLKFHDSWGGSSSGLSEDVFEVVQKEVTRIEYLPVNDSARP